MRTEYIALHTAINYFEDFREESIAIIMKKTQDLNPKSNSYGYAMRIPNAITNLFFYILHDNVPVRINHVETKINGINLYGKDKSLNDELVEIPIKKMQVHNPVYRNSISSDNSRDYYLIDCNYTYAERCVADFNYAVLVKNYTEIVYTELVVKYDEFVELIQTLDKYIKELLTQWDEDHK